MIFDLTYWIVSCRRVRLPTWSSKWHWSLRAYGSSRCCQPMAFRLRHHTRWSQYKYGHPANLPRLTNSLGWTTNLDYQGDRPALSEGLEQARYGVVVDNLCILSDCVGVKGDRLVIKCHILKTTHLVLTTFTEYYFKVGQIIRHLHNHNHCYQIIFEMLIGWFCWKSAVEESNQWKSILICTTWLIGYVSITLTSITQKYIFTVLIPPHVCCWRVKTMNIASTAICGYKEWPTDNIL